MSITTGVNRIATLDVLRGVDSILGTTTQIITTDPVPVIQEPPDKTEFKVDFEQLEIKKRADQLERERRVKNQTATDVRKIVVIGSSQTGGQISTS